MRIALVHLRHAAVGGTESFLNTIAAHLASLGHDVTIVCRRHGAVPHPKVRFIVLRGVAFGAGWRRWRFAQDVETHVQGGDYDLVFALGKTWTHDVIRCGGGCHQTHLDALERHAPGDWERAIGWSAIDDRVSLTLEARAYAPGTSRRVIAISNLVREDLIARYALPPERVELIYNGVDLARFHPSRARDEGAAWRTQVGIADDDVALLFLGSGFQRKGLATLIRAFARVAPTHPHLVLSVVGRDSTRGRFLHLAQELGCAARVRFLGETRAPEAAYAGSDLYVLPTRYDAFAFTILEALASGLPVLTTHGAGASELLGPDVGEVLAAPGAGAAQSAAAEDELAAALVRWNDRDRLARAAPAARALAERHPVERTLERTTEVLLEVAAERARERR